MLELSCFSIVIEHEDVPRYTLLFFGTKNHQVIVIPFVEFLLEKITTLRWQENLFFFFSKETDTEIYMVVKKKQENLSVSVWCLCLCQCIIKGLIVGMQSLHFNEMRLAAGACAVMRGRFMGKISFIIPILGLTR
jgi:hypothetical protein